MEINTGVVQGRFPRRALKALLEWYELHRDDLVENWELAEQHDPLNRVPPLESLQMLEVTAAHYIDQFRIRVRFNNGDESVVDLADALWGTMFEPLKDPMVFRRFEVSGVLHTVQWENDADLAPEYLHQKMVEQRHAAEP